MTVDSGADYTLVRPELVKAEWLPDSPQRLCGVTGDCMSLQGPVDARVSVGGVEEDMPVFVANLDEECLLGHDYLARTGACVDFGLKRMMVRGHDVPFLREVRRPEVVTTKRLRLVPRTEAGRVHGDADAPSRRPCEAGRAYCSPKEPDALRPRPCEADSPGMPSDVACRRLRVPADANECGEQWRVAQRSDPDLVPIVRWLEAGEERPSWLEVAAESPATKCLADQWEAMRVDERGVLVKRWEAAGGVGRDAWLTVVPRALRAEVLSELHGGVMSGHVGERRTLHRLRQRFYWVGMRSDVREWCKACDVCSAKKGPARRNRAPLQLYTVGAPMERVAVDIAGPFPVTPRGNRYICVAMDYFTKWPEAYALPNHEAETVADVLVSEFFSRFGVPAELHSDQGREFESRVFSECCTLLGIQKTRTTPFHPQSDGMVERFNRTLLQQLAKYCGAGQDDWDVKLPAMLMAYRSAVHEATEHTPACLMFGRELRLPVDLATGRPPDVPLPTVDSGFATALQERLVEAHQEVRDKLRTASRTMKELYDRRMRDTRYAVGDKVWLHNPRRRRGLSPKLQSPWEGPYTILAVPSAVTYKIQRGHKRAMVVHADRLWRYHGPGHFSWGLDEPEAEERTDEELRPANATEVEEEVSEASHSEEEVETARDDVGDEMWVADRRPVRNRRPPVYLQDFMLSSP